MSEKEKIEIIIEELRSHIGYLLGRWDKDVATLYASDEENEKLRELVATLEAKITILEKEPERLKNIAKGCHDYNGGYSSEAEYNAFQHGISTVIAALSSSIDSQNITLESIGQLIQEEYSCNVCKDTHLMNYNDRQVCCTFCPVPCSLCRKDGIGAYCTNTPCHCKCHKK